MPSRHSIHNYSQYLVSLCIIPIVVEQGGPIPNYYEPNRHQRESAQNVIAQIDYDDLWRGAGTIADNGVMRVDNQGRIAGPPALYNIQVQVNGISGHSTVAHANVSTSTQTVDKINQTGVVNKVIAALNISLDSGRSCLVTGSIP